MPVVARRTARFDRGLGVVTIDRPVISVGNLSVGGTGKTPVVTRILDILLELGRRPCVATRGYGRGSHRGDHADEVMVYRERFPDVPILARPDRVEAILEHFHGDAGSATDVVVLDDGFQHRRLARQMDMVLLDVVRPFDRDRLLPAGWLREPPESLSRATHVLFTHADCAAPADLERMRARVRALSSAANLGHAEHRWADLQVHSPEESSALPQDRSLSNCGISWLRGRRTVAVCGIGQPESFLRTAREATGESVHPVVLADHAAYNAADLARIRRGFADLSHEASSAGHPALLTTAKDWVKLRDHLDALPPCTVAVPTLSLHITGADTNLSDAVRTTLAAFAAE